MLAFNHITIVFNRVNVKMTVYDHLFEVEERAVSIFLKMMKGVEMNTRANCRCCVNATNQ